METIKLVTEFTENPEGFECDCCRSNSRIFCKIMFGLYIIILLFSLIISYCAFKRKVTNKLRLTVLTLMMNICLASRISYLSFSFAEVNITKLT